MALLNGDQQRHVTRDDLGQNTHGRADLGFIAFIGEQTAQNIGANISLVLGQRAVDPPLLDRRQTMAESILVAGWIGFPAMPAIGSKHSENNGF